MKISPRIVAWLLLIALSTSPCAQAADVAANMESVAADVIIARPLWLVATVLGAGIFVVSLPVAAMSKSVRKTANTLVGVPARATFTRPLGDFSTIE